MPAYRLYYLDGAGRVEAAEWIEAENDSTAATAARGRLDKGVYGELWLGQRFVTRLNHKDATSGDAG